MQSKYFIVGLLLTVSVIGCKKEEIVPLPIKTEENTANVKIIHASAYTINYTVQLKVNGARISNAFTYSTPFPGGGLNTGGSSFPWYLSLAPGSLNIAMTVPKVGTNTDSIALGSGTANIEANKYYSIYLSDTAARTQITVVTENTALPQEGTTRFKFVNLIPNSTSLDLYSGANKVASNVAYNSVSPEFTLPLNDTARFYIRTAGAAPTATPVALYPTLSPYLGPLAVPNKRIMTVFARGYIGTTGTRLPNVSLLYN